MNAMLYVRGRPLDYDLWVKAGAAGWGWNEVLPYFLRAEDNERGASEFHAAGGPLNVADQRSPRQLARDLLAASEAAGIPYMPDYNGPEQDGVAMFQVTQKNGRRWSAADAYLRPALKRANLEVVTGAQVLGLELEGDAVTGVRLERARRGAGGSRRARGDPQRRGDRLTAAADAVRDRARPMSCAHGDPAATSCPAWARTSRTTHLTMLWEVDHADTMVDATHPRHLAEWALRRTGKLSSSAAEVCAFVRTRAGLPAADIQFHAGALYFEDHGAEEHDAPAMTIAPTLVAPASRGEVTLRSADPTAAPRILTNSLTEPEDVASMVAGMELAREIAACEPVRSRVRASSSPDPT